MKTLALMILTLASLPALAAPEAFHCSSKDLDVSLTWAPHDTYELDFKVLADGGKAHFDSIRQVTPAEDIARGAPVHFRNEYLDLKIQTSAAGMPGILTVPASGIDREQLSCR